MKTFWYVCVGVVCVCVCVGKIILIHHLVQTTLSSTASTSAHVNIKVRSTTIVLTLPPSHTLQGVKPEHNMIYASAKPAVIQALDITKVRWCGNVPLGLLAQPSEI
jgi:hypothetical protein